LDERRELNFERQRNMLLVRKHSNQIYEQENHIKELEEEVHRMAEASEGCCPKDEKDTAMKSAGARLLFKIFDRRANVLTGRAFRQWACSISASVALSDQMDVAEEMAMQLRTTREALFKLKAHFEDVENMNSPAHQLESRSLNNSYWEFSESSDDIVKDTSQ